MLCPYNSRLTKRRKFAPSKHLPPPLRSIDEGTLLCAFADSIWLDNSDTAYYGVRSVGGRHQLQRRLGNSTCEYVCLFGSGGMYWKCVNGSQHTTWSKRNSIQFGQSVNAERDSAINRAPFADACRWSIERIYILSSVRVN